MVKGQLKQRFQLNYSQTNSKQDGVYEACGRCNTKLMRELQRVAYTATVVGIKRNIRL